MFDVIGFSTPSTAPTHSAAGWSGILAFSHFTSHRHIENVRKEHVKTTYHDISVSLPTASTATMMGYGVTGFDGPTDRHKVFKDYFLKIIRIRTHGSCYFCRVAEANEDMTLIISPRSLGVLSSYSYSLEQIVIYFSIKYLASILSIVAIGTVGVGIAVAVGIGIGSIGVGGVENGGVSLGLPLAQAVLDQGAGADSEGATVGVLLGVQSRGAKECGDLVNSSLGYRNSFKGTRRKKLNIP